MAYPWTAYTTTTRALALTTEDYWNTVAKTQVTETRTVTSVFTYVVQVYTSSKVTQWMYGISPTLTAVSTTASSTNSATNPSRTSDSTTSGSNVVASASDSSVSSSLASTKLPSQGGSSNVSSGALAGAVIGSIIGGLLLGLIAAWLLFGRRKGKTQGGPPIQPQPKSRDESKAAIITTPSRTASDAHFGQFLLDTTPEGEIRSELQALGTLINQHVEHNYNSGPIASHSLLSQALVRLGFSRNAATIADLCMDPESRPTGIRFVISQTIFRNVDINSLGSASLLPNPVTSFLQAIPRNNDLGKLARSPKIVHVT